MKITVHGENSFIVLTDQMMIGPSEGGYTLAYSADNETFTEYEESTPAGENCLVNGTMRYSYWKLVGNTGDVTVIV